MGKTLFFFLGVLFLLGVLALWPNMHITGADITG